MGAAASASVGASISFTIVLNLIVSQNRNRMLSSIKNLQVIIHLTLFNVIIPANASIFFAIIFKLIAFDPIEISEYVMDIFEIKDTEASDLSPNFLHLGYESASVMLNMGSLLLILTLVIVQIPCLSLLLMCPLSTRKCKTWSIEKLKDFFWN